MAGSAIAAIVSSFVADAVATEVAFSLAGAVVTGAEVWAGSELLIGSVVGGVTGMAASSLVGGIVNNALAPDQPSTSQLSAYEKRGLLVNVSSNVEQIPVIYGSRRVGGARVFVCTSGASNEYLNLVIVLGEGDISAVNNIYINDVISTDARFNGLVTVNAHLGTDGQTVDTLLNAALPTQWNSTHRLQGVAYGAVQLKYDQTAFPSGLPTLTFDVSGRTLYDPRDAATRFSNNPALAIRDYLTNARYGRGIATSSVDDASFIAAANHCDELVSIPGGNGGTTTQKRYSCDGLVDTGNTAYDNIKALLTTCRGMLIFSGGKYRLVIDKSETAAFTFNEDNITGSWQIAQQGKRAKYNRIRAGFFNPARSWQPDIAIQESATWRAADNGLILEKQLDLPFTADIYRAQRIAQQEMIQSRFGLLVRFTAFQEGLRCEVGDVVQISHATPGWVNKQFRVIQIELKNNDEVFVVCREYDASVYAPVPNLAANPAPGTVLPDPALVATPGILSLSSGTATLLRAGDGTIISRIRVAWPLPTDVFVRLAEIRYKRSATTTWEPGVVADAAIGVVYIAPVEDGVSYDVIARFENTIGVRSAWTSPITHMVVGKSELPSSVPWAALTDSTLSFETIADADLAGYRVRWAPGNSLDWGQAQPLHSGLITASPWAMPSVPIGVATLLIKAVDTCGNESLNPAAVVVNLGDPLIDNIITTRDLKAEGFPGQIGGGAVSAGSLLADTTGSIWNPNDAALLWSANDASPMWDLIYYKALTYRTTVTVAAAEVGSQMTIAKTLSGDAYKLEYRRPVGDVAPMWGATDTVMWSGDDNAPMRINAPGWMPWPGAITAEAGDYEIRVHTAFGGTRGRIDALSVNFDVPDITEYLHGISIAALGTRLAPAKSYHAIRAVHLTLQDDGGTARTARVMDKSLAGPLINCFDSSSAAATGHVDAIIQGY